MLYYSHGILAIAVILNIGKINLNQQYTWITSNYIIDRSNANTKAVMAFSLLGKIRTNYR